MEEAEFERIKEKYKEGNSTLSEEKYLFANAEDIDTSLEAWSVFIKNNQTNVPKDFNEKLWQAFENKNNRKRRKLVWLMSVAATVVVLFALALGGIREQKLSYSEKEILLNEAIDMFNEVNEQEKVFYEDDLIIIYTAASN